MENIKLENATTIPIIAKELNVSRQWVYQLWAQSRIAGRKVGKIIILDRADAIRVLNDLKDKSK